MKGKRMERNPTAPTLSVSKLPETKSKTVSPLSSHVGNRAVPLSGSVILTDLRNLESFYKLGPQLHPHPIAEHHPEVVLPLIRTDWGGAQVASQLPDILGGLGIIIIVGESW